MSALEAAVTGPPTGSREAFKQQRGQQGKGGKRPFQQGGQPKKRTKKRERDSKSATHEEVLAKDIEALLAGQRLSPDNAGDVAADSVAPAAEEVLPEQGSEVEVEVLELSTTGDGLAQQKGFKQVYVVPFTVPGDVVKVKAYRHMREGYTAADLLSVVKPAPTRDDSRISCKYFGKCSGCQFQMLDYPEQLKVKRGFVEKAYHKFSQLPPELIPAIQDTIGSPLQYGYRTKLTPHFDGPPGWQKGKTPFTSRPNVGFTPKTSRSTMDIEDCPIGTDAVRMGMKQERARMDIEFHKYVRGSTLLMRESTKRVPNPVSPSDVGPRTRSPSPLDSIKVETERYTDYKTCITDNNGTSTEYIGDYKFTNSAGSFFQNNNSILPRFTEYIREHILPRSTTGDSSPSFSKPVKYLIDAYSGSGLFTITLSSIFESSTGIDVDDKGIQAARKNARDNNLPLMQASFISADAGELFKSNTYPADETVVVLDPPRKGCDSNFLRQLLHFGPRRVVYVSCNVHTQARDVGILVRGETVDISEGADQKDGPDENNKVRYEIESLRGFDFFPQTGHVEGVAILNRVEVAVKEEDKADVASV
ncbi:S-adenosyl-L-methionine-dependent methyltransferase [Xylariales sp. AK1849]|nr:S-adenosyl-L-methionine-dependent methyltransferase [Xylariales sp. AK1849]